MHPALRHCGFLALAAGLSASPLVAEPAFRIDDLGPVTGNAVFLNDFGQAAFVSSGQVYRSGDNGPTPLPTPDRALAVGGINAAGMVTATVAAGDHDEVLLSRRDGGWDDLGPASGLQATFSGPNDAGDVLVADGFYARYWADGAPHPAYVTGWPAMECYAYDINARRQALLAVGSNWYGTLYMQRYTYGTGAETLFSGQFGYALNDDGDVLCNGTILRADGTRSPYARLYNDIVPRELNNAGQVIGNVWINGALARPWLAQNGNAWDLNDLLPTASGWTLQSVRSINNTGQIAGAGMYRGERRAFRLTPAPVPEPSSTALVAVAMLPLAVGLRRRRSREAADSTERNRES